MNFAKHVHFKTVERREFELIEIDFRKYIARFSLIEILTISNDARPHKQLIQLQY
jgi:hypothetical protein